MVNMQALDAVMLILANEEAAFSGTQPRAILRGWLADPTLLDGLRPLIGMRYRSEIGVRERAIGEIVQRPKALRAWRRDDSF